LNFRAVKVFRLFWAYSNSEQSMFIQKFKSNGFRVLAILSGLAKWIEIAETFGVLRWSARLLEEIMNFDFD